MKIYRYSVVRKKYRFLTLLLIIILSLSLAISTSYIYAITYSINNFVAGKYPVIVDKNSRLGFTGLLDISGLIDDKNITEFISPEIITPIFANNTLSSLRGVYPNMFRTITPYKVISGHDLENNDLTGALVGNDLALKRGIDPGDMIIITSFWNRNPIVIHVVGIIDVEKPFSYEVIVNIHLARLIRGLKTGYVNIIRLKPAKENLIKYISSKLPKDKALVLNRGEQLTYYASRIGISPHVFLIALIPSLIVSFVSMKYLIDGLNDEHQDIYETLEVLGYTQSDIKFMTAYNLLKYVIIGVILGFAANLMLLYLIDNIMEIRFLIPIFVSTINPLVFFLILIILPLVLITFIIFGGYHDEK